MLRITRLTILLVRSLHWWWLPSCKLTAASINAHASLRSALRCLCTATCSGMWYRGHSWQQRRSGDGLVIRSFEHDGCATVCHRPFARSFDSKQIWQLRCLHFMRLYHEVRPERTLVRCSWKACRYCKIEATILQVCSALLKS